MNQEHMDKNQCIQRMNNAINTIKTKWDEIINDDLTNIKEIWSDPLCDDYTKKIISINSTVEKIISELKKIKSAID